MFIDLQSHPDFAAVAPSGAIEPAAMAVPAINTNPTQESIRDGFLVIKPAGALRSAYHLGHMHGWGGISNGEDELLHSLASGKRMGEPVTVAAPLSKLVDPKKNWIRNTDDAVTLLRYMMSKPTDIRDQFLSAFAGQNKGLWGNTKGIIETLASPSSWFSFDFDNKSLLAKVISLGKAIIEPNYDRTIEAMAAAGERVAPLLLNVLNEVGAVAGNIKMTGFSQGGAVALGALKHLPAGYVDHLILISSTYVETEASPKIRNNTIKLDVVCPRGDVLLEMIGIKEHRMLADLAAAFPGHNNVWRPEGNHSLAGEVADLVVDLLRGTMPHAPYGHTALTPGG